MPESVPDYTTSIATLERKLRNLRRSIMGCVEVGKSALVNPESSPLFEVTLEGASTDWVGRQQPRPIYPK